MHAVSYICELVVYKYIQKNNRMTYLQVVRAFYCQIRESLYFLFSPDQKSKVKNVRICEEIVRKKKNHNAGYKNRPPSCHSVCMQTFLTSCCYTLKGKKKAKHTKQKKKKEQKMHHMKRKMSYKWRREGFGIEDEIFTCDCADVQRAPLLWLLDTTMKHSDVSENTSLLLLLLEEDGDTLNSLYSSREKTRAIGKIVFFWLCGTNGLSFWLCQSAVFVCLFVCFVGLFSSIHVIGQLKQHSSFTG